MSLGKGRGERDGVRTKSKNEEKAKREGEEGGTTRANEVEGRRMDDELDEIERERDE